MQLNIRVDDAIHELVFDSAKSVHTLQDAVRDLIDDEVFMADDEVRLLHKGNVLWDPEQPLSDTAVRNQDTVVALLIRAWHPAPPRPLVDVEVNAETILAATRHFAMPRSPIQVERAESTEAVEAEAISLPPRLEDMFTSLGLDQTDVETQGMSTLPHIECVSQLTELGFSEAAATKALLVCGHDIEQATEWLLDHPDEAHNALAEMQAEQLDSRGQDTPLPAGVGILDEASPLVQEIRTHPDIQEGFMNPRVLEAFFTMTKDPDTAHRFLADPEIGPVLMQLHAVVVNHCQAT